MWLLDEISWVCVHADPTLICNETLDPPPHLSNIIPLPHQMSFHELPCLHTK